MKITKALTTGIAALAFAASAVTTTATFTPAPARAVCRNTPPGDPGGYSGNPFDCQDPFPTNAVTVPPGPGPFQQDWGQGLPCSTDPRFLGCPGATPDQNFLFYMGRAGISQRYGSQDLVQAGHEVCSNLSHGVSYDHMVNFIAAKGALTRDQAVLLVEDAHAFYCPTL